MPCYLQLFLACDGTGKLDLQVSNKLFLQMNKFQKKLARCSTKIRPIATVISKKELRLLTINSSQWRKTHKHNTFDEEVQTYNTLLVTPVQLVQETHHELDTGCLWVLKPKSFFQTNLFLLPAAVSFCFLSQLIVSFIYQLFQTLHFTLAMGTRWQQ